MFKKVLGVLSIACVMMLAACAPQKQEEVPEEIIEEESTVVEEVIEETDTVSTLTGLPVTEKIRNQRPLAVMLLNRNATVTICHSHTKNLSDITKTADISRLKT